MKNQKASRRRFLKDGAAVAGLSLGAPRLITAQTPASPPADAQPRDLHAYGERSHFETAGRLGNNGYSLVFRVPGATYNGGPRTPLHAIEGYITPASWHYFVNHSYESVDIDPREHRLMIHGMVDRPLIFTMDDLKRLPSVTRVHFMECRANSNPNLRERKLPEATVQLTHGLTSSSVWTGVPLPLLLKEAGVQKGGTWILAEGADQHKHTKSIPMGKAMDDVLVAYGQNGEAVRPEQGYPLRLLAPGYEGINSVKWLRRIKVVNEPYMARAETTQYPELRPDGKARWFNSEMGPSSVITRPAGGQKLPGKGFYEITGLAWSGAGVVKRVEVSTDGGKTWKDAELQGPIHSKAHTRFGLPWNWNGDEAILQSRCTDERGQTQPTKIELAKFWSLPDDYFETVPIMFGHYNAIQPWRVTREGSVLNAMFA